MLDTFSPLLSFLNSIRKRIKKYRDSFGVLPSMILSKLREWQKTVMCDLAPGL